MDFNQYDDRSYRELASHAVSFSGQEQEFFIQRKADLIVQIAESEGIDIHRSSLLDVGCGIGLLEQRIAGSWQEITGVDIAPSAIEHAAKKASDNCRFLHYDGKVLPFSDDAFDVTVAVCVMHHVAPSDWQRFLGEMARVTRADGLVMIFEHNPLNPATRLVVSRCPYDEDAVLLSARILKRLFRAAGLKKMRRRYVIFFPWESRFFTAVEGKLGWLPLGAQYVVLGKPAFVP